MCDKKVLWLGGGGGGGGGYKVQNCQGMTDQTPEKNSNDSTWLWITTRNFALWPALCKKSQVYPNIIVFKQFRWDKLAVIL